MNLQENYKRLFKGRLSSNDKKILKENILSNDDFYDVVDTIAQSADSGDDMTDDIIDELGDFYDDVYDSDDNELINAYNALRQTSDESPEEQAEAAYQLLQLLG